MSDFSDFVEASAFVLLNWHKQKRLVSISAELLALGITLWHHKP